MTVKEIQEIMDVDERTIRRWVEKLGDNLSAHFEQIREKLAAAVKGDPAQLTIDEAIAIIEVSEHAKSGVMKSLLLENAANKDALLPAAPRTVLPKDMLDRIGALIDERIGALIAAETVKIAEAVHSQLEGVKNELGYTAGSLGALKDRMSAVHYGLECLGALPRVEEPGTKPYKEMTADEKKRYDGHMRIREIDEFAAENILYTRQRGDKISVEQAYFLYNEYTKKPLTMKDFAVEFCCRYVDCAWEREFITGCRFTRGRKDR
jgi:hypothetical protein